jgi:hypothetical protein
MTGRFAATTSMPSPYPGRSEPLPWTVDAVTPEWLTRTLAHRYPGIVVEAMEVRQFIDSHTSKLRIAATYNDIGREAGIAANLCLKSNWSGDFADVDICELEAHFYHFLRPHLTVPVARCFYADWDAGEKTQGIIVLEDLTDLGGRFGHSLDANGIDGVALALEDLAAMHGDLWGSPILDRQPWLPTSMSTHVDNDQIRIMQRFIDKNLADPDIQRIVPAALIDDPGRLQRGFDALIALEAAQTSPRCLLLGDCHQGNTYVLPDGHRMWIDWQLVRKGRPWRDLTYFMIGCLSVDDRRAAERDLLATYRAALVATGAQGVPSDEEIWWLYRRWVLYGMQAWIANMDVWGQIGLPMNERFFTAGEDHDTWKLLGL